MDKKHENKSGQTEIWWPTQASVYNQYFFGGEELELVKPPLELYDADMVIVDGKNVATVLECKDGARKPTEYIYVDHFRPKSSAEMDPEELKHMLRILGQPSSRTNRKKKPLRKLGKQQHIQSIEAGSSGISLLKTFRWFFSSDLRVEIDLTIDDLSRDVKCMQAEGRSRRFIQNVVYRHVAGTVSSVLWASIHYSLKKLAKTLGLFNILSK